MLIMNINPRIQMKNLSYCVFRTIRMNSNYASPFVCEPSQIESQSLAQPHPSTAIQYNINLIPVQTLKTNRIKEKQKKKCSQTPNPKYPFDSDSFINIFVILAKSTGSKAIRSSFHIVCPQSISIL